MSEITEYISEARKNITLKKYHEAASIYEKLGKMFFKTDVKTALNFFKLAVKYYDKSIAEYDKARKLVEAANCSECIGRIYKKWFNDAATATDYFISATKYMIKASKMNLGYKNGDKTNKV
ncbi:MAG: hypothetical protein OdinLCB4_001265 [Candidatus Odinarchaeum yellowstonii]|uniref:Tetratricopeptide repeat protein n=1 Tax=Odinarchaeota yellowstonii (strain LCB_4) TaxID=1841599 RepID=A0AAF0D2Q7_ODILC|nr:MAG: hypothetical protein OdinLCB4_001265 [Candidatus Odinarchaeum yellowstonii]